MLFLTYVLYLKSIRCRSLSPSWYRRDHSTFFWRSDY